MRMRLVVGLALAASSALVMACGGGPGTAGRIHVRSRGCAGRRRVAHEGHVGGRVFFVSPKEGATVKSPVQFEFGSDMFTIAAVPAGEVTAVRAGTGHFHLGVDTDCLPVGAVIPKANPWIHFGDGKNAIEMQLTPGPHKLAVQAGDDKHATMTGLCETISVTVTE